MLHSLIIFRKGKFHRSLITSSRVKSKKEKKVLLFKGIYFAKSESLIMDSELKKRSEDCTNSAQPSRMPEEFNLQRFLLDNQFSFYLEDFFRDLLFS